MTVLGVNSIGGTAYTDNAQSHLISGVAGSSGALSQLFIYCAGNSGTSTTLTMAIYADSSGNPGARLGITNALTIPNGQVAGWLELDLTAGITVTNGTTYWLALATNGGGGGTFRYTGTGTTKGRGNSTLPDPYGTPGWTDSATFSMYGTIGTPVPTNSVAPTISGSTSDRSTLTSTTGTWANTPTSYAYQWTRDGTNISGATASTYVVQLADRTHVIRCVVTASNAGGAGSPTTSSNSLTGTAPTVSAAGKLKYAPPAQNSPITIDLTSTPGDYFGVLTPGADYIFNLSPTVQRTGEIEVDANGARSIKIIGGLWALNDGGTKNYHIHFHNLMGWAFIEGQEADMSLTHADFLVVSGGSLYRPDVYFQNSRIINLTATDATNHADVFQPQGLVGRVYIDKVTFSSNYQGFTISADSTGSAPAGAFTLSRINSWFQAANATNPITYHYWLNGATGTANNDHPPFPIAFDDVWCDLTRGYGRSYSGISDVIYPSEFAAGAGKAGGGTCVEGGVSIFANGEFVGAQDSGDGLSCSLPNVKMKVGGSLHSGSPLTGRSDVITDQDGRGSFVPAGIGSNYSTPGYLPRPRSGILI